MPDQLMPLLNIILLALALAVDAFAVSFSYGAVLKQRRMSNSLALATATGFGQFIMPVLGFIFSSSVHYYVASFDHWIAFGVFALLGSKVVFDAFWKNDDETHLHQLSFKALCIIGIATSIDAFIAGASLYIMINGGSCGYSSCSWAIIPGLIIGAITFICAFFGFHLAKVFHRIPTKVLECAAGITLIAIGLNILIEHLSE